MQTNDSPITVLIADDHSIFLDGFKLLLTKLKPHGIECIGTALNGKLLIDQVGKLKPEIVFTDIQMPEMDGIEATKIIKEKYPETKVIAFSTFNQASFVLDMVEAGAAGYVLKNTTKEELLIAIKTAHAGGMYYCPAVSVHLAKQVKEQTVVKEEIAFSYSETQIIIYICKGLTSKEIAEQLHLSKRTVESYKEKIMEKIDATRSAEIIVYAIKHGIYTP